MPPKKKKGGKKKAAAPVVEEAPSEFDAMPAEQLNDVIAELKAKVDRAQLDRNQVQLDRVRACGGAGAAGLERACDARVRVRAWGGVARRGGAGHDPDVL